MKAQDLFPGAVVSFSGSEYTVESFNSQKGPQDTIIFDGKAHRVAMTKSLEPIPLTPEILTEWFGGGLYYINDLEGIPLTPEILTDWLRLEPASKILKRRWNLPSNSFDFYGRIFLTHEEGDDGDDDIFAVNITEMSTIDPYLIILKYVHQLQRIHHAITGQPLERRIRE